MSVPIWWTGESSGFRVYSFGFRGPGFGFRVSGLGLGIYALASFGFRAEKLGLHSGFMMQGRVSGLYVDVGAVDLATHP